MASPVPAKSQAALHSFSLSKWKLTKNHTNNHHRGRQSHQQLPSSDSPLRLSPMLDSSARQSPMRDSASESEFSLANPVNRKKSAAHIGGKNRSLVSPSKSDKQSSSVLDVDKNGEKESRSKIYSPYRSNSNSKPNEVHVEEGEAEETFPKTWNLRPRKPVAGKQSDSSLGRTSLPDNHNKSQSPQRGARRADMRSSEATENKGKKRKFSIPLSRDEIEEDIFCYEWI